MGVIWRALRMDGQVSRSESVYSNAYWWKDAGVSAAVVRQDENAAAKETNVLGQAT